MTKKMCMYKMVTVEGIFVFIDITIIHLLDVYITSLCVCVYLFFTRREREKGEILFFNFFDKVIHRSLDPTMSKEVPTSDIVVTPVNADQDLRRNSRTSASSSGLNDTTKSTKNTAKSVINFLYNPKEKTVLGRSALDWGMIRLI